MKLQSLRSLIAAASLAPAFARIGESETNISDEKRLMLILKTRWPECVQNNLTALQCKALVDSDIAKNTGDDKYIPSIILWKRTREDGNANFVVLTADQNDHVTGRNKDGLIHYDWSWDGAGVAAPQDQVDLPPTGDFNPSAVSTQGGLETLDSVMWYPVDVHEAGPRSIGPWNCSGMTVIDCCKLIKHVINDANTDGKSMQCYANYHKDTEKFKEVMENKDKKVMIFATEDKRVSRTPEMIGLPIV